MSAPPSTTGRPSAARERILDTADRLFYAEGVHPVGIQRIIAEAQVTRVTLYRHFPAKDDLVTAYLQRRAQADHDQVGAVLARHRDDPRAALRALAVELTADDFGAVRRGCPFVNASAEFPQGHPVRRHAEEIRTWVTGELRRLLEDAGHDSPARTAVQLMMLRTGAVVAAALEGGRALGEDFVAAWDGLVDAGIPGGRTGPG
ncbi:TetR/AcrR family transcriptional regulator [Kineococcus rhizosphaerae]|uniref:TetR family transcriptional regulator n=1 Tax=Kineococcus rhizosphaerae TaxID=559628 RepID=A0A2T0R4C7_9ACTN|nr:TetR/AcrR family transcriptional regulator [Kineococcus rhizosphaerae]PRY15180.1 TetR family transcriptional regulator [Kineococcus rhizosphaerae]